VGEYLLAHTTLRLAILTDAYDVIVNELSALDLEERFASLTAATATAARRPPGLVLSTEDTCWIGMNCGKSTKNAFVRARLHADPNAGHRFMHSQMMGTRAALIDLIQSGLASGETDDMKMMFDYIVADASRVAFDDDETIFGTFARGFVPGASTSTKHAERSMMCWDGLCAVDRNGTKAVTCSTNDASTSVALHDPLKGRTISPLMWHLNGPSSAFVSRHPTCATAIERASGVSAKKKKAPKRSTRHVTSSMPSKKSARKERPQHATEAPVAPSASRLTTFIHMLFG